MKFTNEFRELSEKHYHDIGVYYCMDEKGKVLYVGSSERVGITLNQIKRHIQKDKYHSIRVAILENKVDADIYTLLYRAIYKTNGVTETTQFTQVTHPQFSNEVKIFECRRRPSKDVIFLSAKDISDQTSIAPRSVLRYCDAYKEFLITKRIGNKWFMHKDSIPLLLKIRKLHEIGYRAPDIKNMLGSEYVTN